MEKRAASIHFSLLRFQITSTWRARANERAVYWMRELGWFRIRVCQSMGRKSGEGGGLSFFPHKEPFLIAFPLLMFVLIHIQRSCAEMKFLFLSPRASPAHISCPRVLIILRPGTVLLCHFLYSVNIAIVTKQSLFADQQVSRNKALRVRWVKERVRGENELLLDTSFWFCFSLWLCVSNSLSAPIIWPIGYCVRAISVRAPQLNTWLSLSPIQRGQMRILFASAAGGGRFCVLCTHRCGSDRTLSSYYFDYN